MKWTNIEKFTLINRDRSKIKVFETSEDFLKNYTSIDEMGYGLRIYLESFDYAIITTPKKYLKKLENFKRFKNDW